MKLRYLMSMFNFLQSIQKHFAKEYIEDLVEKYEEKILMKIKNILSSQYDESWYKDFIIEYELFDCKTFDEIIKKIEGEVKYKKQFLINFLYHGFS